MEKEVSEFFKWTEDQLITRIKRPNYTNRTFVSKEVGNMPRRNENAFENPYHRKLSRWDRGYQPIGPELDRSNPPQGGSGVPQFLKTSKCIKVTGESIVRDFRKAEGLNFYKDLESMRPLFRPPHRPFFLKRWINAVNWWLVMNWVCWAAVIGCLIYLGIFVFAPFTAKLLR